MYNNDSFYGHTPEYPPFEKPPVFQAPAPKGEPRPQGLGYVRTINHVGPDAFGNVRLDGDVLTMGGLTNSEIYAIVSKVYEL